MASSLGEAGSYPQFMRRSRGEIFYPGILYLTLFFCAGGRVFVGVYEPPTLTPQR